LYHKEESKAKGLCRQQEERRKNSLSLLAASPCLIVYCNEVKKNPKNSI